MLAAFMTFWSGAIIALVWGTYRRLENRIDRLEDGMNAQLSRVDDRFARVDERFGMVDSQIAGLRADLTQIALAVGARPRASEG